MTKDAPIRKSGLVYPRPDPQAIMRLFCFPYAGAPAAIYFPWANGALANVEVCAIELPGRGSRMHEPALTTITSQVDSIFAEIHQHLDKPFAFWGHSMGSIIAYELMRRLTKENGIGPAHLFVSGRQAPHIPDKFLPTYDLPEPELLSNLKRLNGTPREVLESPELMQLMLPILRADLAAIDTYTYSTGPLIDCPVTVFGGVRDPEVDREGLAGWSELTTGTFSLRMLPGDHFFLHSAQPLLLKIVYQGLQRIMETL